MASPHDKIALIIGAMKKAKSGGGDSSSSSHDDGDARLEAMKGFIDAVDAKDAESALEWWDKVDCKDDSETTDAADEGGGLEE
jgi:hypothetical protein